MYEYKCAGIGESPNPLNEGKEFAEFCNRQAQEGWELVSAIRLPFDGYGTLRPEQYKMALSGVFRREKKQ